MYEKGLTGDINTTHDRTCNAGTVRMTFRLGEISKGISMAFNAQDKQLFHDSASILEAMKQFQEAATMYEKGQQYDKAVAIYLRSMSMPTLYSYSMHAITTPSTGQTLCWFHANMCS